MHFLKQTPVSSRWLSRSPSFLFILGCVCAYLWGQVIFIPQAQAITRGAPGGRVSDPVVRQVDIARPAIVRIITTIDAHLSVRFASNSAPVAFPRDHDHYSLRLSGSGAFISSHGDILTASHVVSPEHDESMKEYLYELAAQDIADYINANYQVTQPFTAADVVINLESGLFPSTEAYEKPESEVYLSTAYTGVLNANSVSEIAPNYHAVVDEIKGQLAFEEGDVAIVHVGGMDDMPSIVLGDSSDVVEQDNLTIIGFPGNGDLDNSPTNLLTSSINKVYVSAIKSIRQGVPVIQVGGNVEHGDSGGPALDDSGNIVGIVSFGLIDANNPGQTAFLQVSNNARKLIERAGIDVQPGTFERAWVQAFNDYASSAAGHWHRAAQELNDLLQHYKGFLGAAAYLDYAQEQAEHEQLPAPSSASLNITEIAVSSLLVLVLLGVLFLIIFRRRNRKVALSTSTHFPSGAYGVSAIQPRVPGNYSPGFTGNRSTLYSPPEAGSVVEAYPPTPYTAPAWYEQSETRAPFISPQETPFPAVLEKSEETQEARGTQEVLMPTIEETPFPVFLSSQEAEAFPIEMSIMPSPEFTGESEQEVQSPAMDETASPDLAIEHQQTQAIVLKEIVPPEPLVQEISEEPLAQESEQIQESESTEVSLPDSAPQTIQQVPFAAGETPVLPEVVADDEETQVYGSGETPVLPGVAEDDEETQMYKSGETPLLAFERVDEQPLQFPKSSQPLSAGETPIPAVLAENEQEELAPVANESAFLALLMQDSWEEAPAPISPPVENQTSYIALLMQSNREPLSVPGGETALDEKALTPVETLQTHEKSEFQPDTPSVSKSFAVPKRPSALSQASEGVVASGWADYSAELHAQIAPCGHPNTADVRFCRICGKPVGAQTSR